MLKGTLMFRGSLMLKGESGRVPIGCLVGWEGHGTLRGGGKGQRQELSENFLVTHEATLPFDGLN